jgi:hypothetical protein
MKLPNWFKIIWWIILLSLSGLILFKRYNAIIEGNSVPIDIFIFLVFTALMLVPIFSEINFFGIKLKQSFEELKHEVNIKFNDIKSEIRNTQTQNLYATFQGLGPLPPDNKLPELENKINTIANTLQDQSDAIVISKTDVPDDNTDLFKIRYNIEKQLKRIWFSRFEVETIGLKIRYQPTLKIIQDLLNYEIIDKDFYVILREILSICNYAIHGENVTENQIYFVTKNSKQVINYLYKI